MDAGTIIAITAPNAVAATAIIVGWRQHISGLGAQRRLADLDNVRTVLDDAAVSLHQVAYALDGVRSNLGAHGRGFFKTKESAKPYHDLERAGKDFDALRERLAIRFGRDHAVVQAFTGANDASLDIYRAIGRIKLEPAADSPAAVRQVAKFMDETRERVTQQRAVFDQRRDEFMDAAQRTAGADLPGQAAAHGITNVPEGTLAAAMDDASERERATALLDLLEARRLATDNSMWQAPTLTLIAQAFLLGVLTDESVGWWVASAVAAAGILAALTAMLALWLLHDRERHFGERVKQQAIELGLGNPNRTSDRGKRHPLEWPGWVAWEVVLSAFLVADALAFALTTRG